MVKLLSFSSNPSQGRKSIKPSPESLSFWTDGPPCPPVSLQTSIPSGSGSVTPASTAQPWATATWKEEPNLSRCRARLPIQPRWVSSGERAPSPFSIPRQSRSKLVEVGSKFLQVGALKAPLPPLLLSPQPHGVWLRGDTARLQPQNTSWKVLPQEK